MGFISVCGVSIAFLASVSTSNFVVIEQSQQPISESIVRSQDPVPQAAEHRSEWVRKEDGDYAEFFAKLAILSTIPVPYQQPVFSMKAQQRDPRYVSRPRGQAYKKR